MTILNLWLLIYYLLFVVLNEARNRTIFNSSPNLYPFLALDNLCSINSVPLEAEPLPCTYNISLILCSLHPEQRTISYQVSLINTWQISWQRLLHNQSLYHNIDKIRSRGSKYLFTDCKVQPLHSPTSASYHHRPRQAPLFYNLHDCLTVMRVQILSGIRVVCPIIRLESRILVSCWLESMAT
jgi:hypothetical protein